ncbi:conjugal transfer protein TraF [Candidatus Parcubacteria bacterium]|nr:MAG: conjugal transfer protein TraF [Candidatus Parcubacteria bacterium]
MRYGKAALLSAAIAAFAANAFAGESRAFDRYKEKDEGWYWKNDKAPQKEEKKSSKAKKPFSVEWLRENLPKLRDRAIDNPTPENLRAYLYAQRVAMDKAHVFAKRAHDIVISDPLLDEKQRLPMASFAVADRFHIQDEARTAILKDLAKKGGLWFFYKSDCIFCKTMANGVRQFAQKYGFILYPISLDGKPAENIKYFYKDQGQAKKLGIKVVPTVMYVVPPNNYYFVAQGAMAPQELSDRIILAAKTEGLVNKKYLALLDVDDRGVLGPDALSDGATDDPVELVANIRKKLLQQYDHDKVPDVLPEVSRADQKPASVTQLHHFKEKGADK